MGLTLLSPLGLLLALVVAVPIAALALAERRAARVGSVLGLVVPARRRRVTVGLALAAVAGLLALAAAQPVVGSSEQRRVDVDSEALFVFDVSRSMAASHGPGEPTRLERARRLALRVRARLAAYQAGAASLSRRVLPYLFPTADEDVFATTVDQAVAVDSPPAGPPSYATLLAGGPTDVATDFGSLAALPASGYFSSTATRRLVILLSDDESVPFRPSGLAATFDGPPRVRTIVVRFGDAGERIYGAGGRPDPRYRPQPNAAATAVAVARATGGRLFGEGDEAGIVRAARADLAGGRVEVRRLRQTRRPLAAWFAAGSLLPLLVVLRRRNL
jgi:hypothetical protein